MYRFFFFFVACILVTWTHGDRSERPRGAIATCPAQTERDVYCCCLYVLPVALFTSARVSMQPVGTRRETIGRFATPPAPSGTRCRLRSCRASPLSNRSPFSTSCLDIYYCVRYVKIAISISIEPRVHATDRRGAFSRRDKRKGRRSTR